MKIRSFMLHGLAAAAGLFSVGVSAISLNGTTSVKATFTSTVEAGTCMAQIQDTTGTPVSTLAFGNVYKSDLTAKSRSEPFSLAFTACVGVKSATVQTQKGTGGICAGDAFDAGNAAAFEVWQGMVDSGTLLSCNAPANQSVPISSGTGKLDLAARIVIANGKAISDVTTGNVSAPVTFVVTYQ